ncbi:hypothetical protein R6Q59_006119 [Mikania micrantha]
MSGSNNLHDHNDDTNSLFFPSGKPINVKSRILFVVIIVISTVVAVVVMLHVYATYMHRRQARRRVVLQGVEVITSRDEVPRRGLKPDVITSLPILMYKNNDHVQDHSRVNLECTVCLSSFEDGQMIRALPSCKHHFHAECIDKWLESQSSCPVCRHEVELVKPTIPSLPREPSVRFGERVGPPSAPPLEHTVSTGLAKEGTSDETVQSSSKLNGTNSR